MHLHTMPADTLNVTKQLLVNMAQAIGHGLAVIRQRL